MAIASYLAYPVEEKRDELLKSLQQHPCCDVVPSKNSDVFILVTETNGEDEEKDVQRFLQQLETLQCLAMVYGEIEPNQTPKG